jgi:predicted O-methyltransferase YrrM
MLRRQFDRFRGRLSRLKRSYLKMRTEEFDFRSGLGDSAWILYGLARSIKPEVCVEIGSARGKSACFVGMALCDNRRGRLYAIDPHTRTDWNDRDSVDSYGFFNANIRAAQLTRYVEVIRKTSEEAARDWDRPIDLIFIDGDHTYEGVRRDWELFSPFLSRFGVAIFHDTTWHIDRGPAGIDEKMGVPRMVDELRREGYPVITIDRDYGVSLVQGTRSGIPLR